MPKIHGFIVEAFEDRNGKKVIRIHTIYSNNIEDIYQWTSSFCSKHYAHWQTSWYLCIKDVRSSIMRDYGIGWFNRARQKLDILSLQYPERIHG